MFIELVGLVVALLFLSFWINSRSRRNLPPGPSPIFPFIGNIPHLIKYGNETSFSTCRKLVEDFGPVCYVKFGGISQVVIEDLDVAKEILADEVWTERLFDRMISERSWGKVLGIIFSYGDVWKEMRRFTMRTLRDFGFGKQLSMESVIDEEIQIIMNNLDKVAEKKESLSMRQFFTISILNLLWSMIAGFKFSHDDKRLAELINLVDETSKNNPVKASLSQAFPFLWPLLRFSPRHQRRRVFFTQLQEFFREILKERRLDGGYKGDPKDFIDVFLQEIDSNSSNDDESPKPLVPYNDEQFIMVCFDLFIAGAETTSNTLEFAILYMILNPEVQKKVQQEIDSVVGRDRRPMLHDKPNLPYTEATVLEIQRVANVLPMIIRGANKSTTVCGYNIPKGTLAAINTHALHNSNTIWGDPEEFRPERFLDADKYITNAGKILPFGYGKRVCLGEVLAKASLFTYFATLIQRYTIMPSLKHSTPTYKPVPGFTLSPAEYFVNLKRR